MAAFRLIYVIAVVGLLAKTSQSHPHHGLFKDDRELLPDECEDVTTINNLCSKDCTSLITCRTGSPILVKDCSESALFCYKSVSIVTCNRISQCGGPIWCTQEGVYPDSDNCKIYHTCAGVNVMSTPATCEDSGFDLSTHACGLPLDDVTCQGEGPVPDCKFSQQRGVLPANPAHWYKCMILDNVLYPGQYQCADGEVYDPAFSQCVTPIETTPTMSTTPTTTETSTETTPTMSTTLTTTETSTETTTQTTTETTSESTIQTFPTETTTVTIPTESTTVTIPTESTTVTIPTESTTVSIPTESTTVTIPTESTTLTLPTEKLPVEMFLTEAKN